MRLFPRVSYRENVFVKCRGNWVETECRDISLLGIKFKSLEDESCEDRGSIKVKLNTTSGQTVLRGRLYRKDNGEAVMIFNESDEILANTVGSLITHLIRENGKCPYCKSDLENEERCSKCGMPVDFTSVRIIGVIRSIKIGDLISGLLLEEIGEEICEEKVEFIGTCPQMKQIFELIRKYAPVDYPVLILGETGTGKELTARAIHERSFRAKGPFVVINCAAIPKELLEAELFGFEKGAFTGADRRKRGKIELADGGTLFLDEIGELPLDLQVKLLRFLEDLSFERIGGTKKIKADIRIIAATNRDLEELTRKGLFREDLYFRLKVLTINLPPLRERGDDIVVMAKYFLEKFSDEQGKKIEGFTDEALELIRNYQWPGNVRELINVIRKAAVLTDKRYIDVEDLDIDSSRVSKEITGKAVFNLKEHMEKLERELVEKAYRIAEGNVSKMASMLGISRPTVYKLMEKYGLG